MEHVQAWYQATGDLETFQAIDAETRNANLKELNWRKSW